jgi:hypothetical protein
LKFARCVNHKFLICFALHRYPNAHIQSALYLTAV